MGWNCGAVNPPKLLNSGKLLLRAQAAVSTGTAGVWWETAFRIFCWLEVADFALVSPFLFLCSFLHFIPFLFGVFFDFKSLQTSFVTVHGCRERLYRCSFLSPLGCKSSRNPAVDRDSASYGIHNLDYSTTELTARLKEFNK